MIQQHTLSEGSKNFYIARDKRSDEDVVENYDKEKEGNK